MKEIALRGLTGNIAFVWLGDSSSTTGGGKTGLTNASAGLIVSVRREKSSVMTAYSGANIGAVGTLGTWADPTAGKCNFKEVDATNAPGLYEIHFVDLLFGTSDTSRKLVGMVQATGVVPTPFEISLSGVDVQNATTLGIGALPAFAAGAAGGLPIGDAAGRVTTNYGLHKNTLLNNFEFPMVLSSDHISPGLGLTVTGQVSLDGVSFVNLTNSPVEVGSGVYKINLAAADLNGTMVVLKFTATGADPTLIGLITQS